MRVKTIIGNFVFLTLLLHVEHGEDSLNQRVPHFVLHLFSRYEHLFMRSINYLAMRNWIHRFRITKRIVDRISELVIKNINGEILTLDESCKLIEEISRSGHTIAIGTCPCRRARNQLSDEKPNNTDMVFGRWAEEYMENYPGLYKQIDKEEALRLVKEFDDYGYFHQLYGWTFPESAAFVLCNCAPEVCIPLQAQRARGYTSFRKGRNTAFVNEEACLGVEDCGICIERCPFGARSENRGKSAVNTEICYGCGLCVSTCRGGASSLRREAKRELIFAARILD